MKFRVTIRPFESTDLPFVMDIWLSENQKAHAFVTATYWEENYDLVAPSPGLCL